jgi:hypothetical protein
MRVEVLTPGAGGKYDTFESHFANHAQAYRYVTFSMSTFQSRASYLNIFPRIRCDAVHLTQMDTHAIDSAAAVEALKMSTGQN